MRHCRRILPAVTLSLFVVPWVLVAQEPAPKPGGRPASEPPYKRLLQADDAKRAAALDKRMAELITAAKFTDAVRVAGELHQLRRQVQGADHWETINARWEAAALQCAAQQPAESQRHYAALGPQMKEAEEAQAQGRYAQAEALERRW